MILSLAIKTLPPNLRKPLHIIITTPLPIVWWQLRGEDETTANRQVFTGQAELSTGLQGDLFLALYTMACYVVELSMG